MKFYITRVSQHTQFVNNDPQPPCEGAVKDGHDHGIQLYSIEIKDLDHLLKLADKEGEVALCVGSLGPMLEICDDYRE